jgi:hypothetical protein
LAEQVQHPITAFKWHLFTEMPWETTEQNGKAPAAKPATSNPASNHGGHRHHMQY